MTTKAKVQRKAPTKHFRTPKELHECLNPVLYQADMKRKLVSAFSQFSLSLDDPSVGRPLVMVVGPSGSGKTMAVELLAHHMELPLSIFSAGSISPPGYRGTTVKDKLQEHTLEQEKRGVHAGIIVLDEIDKWTRTALQAAPGSEAVASGNHCQAEILRYVERETVSFVDEARDDDALEGMYLETKNILWVLLGAFTGIDAFVRHRLNQHLDLEECLYHMLPEDLVEYGVLNELAARINTWVWAKPLKRTHLREILQVQQVPLWKKRFAAVGCQLTIDDGALGRCGDAAFDLGTGARGAMAMLRRSMDDLFYEVSMAGLTKLHVDVGMVVTGKLDAGL